VFAAETRGSPRFPCRECTDSYGAVLADSGFIGGFLVTFLVKRDQTRTDTSSPAEEHSYREQASGAKAGRLRASCCLNWCPWLLRSGATCRRRPATATFLL
jgi:hypothetical protein